MKTRMIIIFCLLAWSASYGQNTASAKHQMHNLAGTYTLLLVDNLLADGSRVHLYGDDPHGILMLDNKGNYCLQILSEGRPQFKAGDKSKGNDEENLLVVK